MILGGDDSVRLREHVVDGKPRWQWVTTNLAKVGVADAQCFDHQVWLSGPENTVMWEVWHGRTCLEVRDTGKTGVDEARNLVARVRKNGQDTKVANRAFETFKE